MKPTNHARKLSHLIALLLAGLTLSSPAWAVGYTITDLGTNVSAGNFVFGINGNGQVVGLTGDGATLWNNDSSHTPTVLLGPPRGGALGINNSGQVVGSTSINFSTRATVWGNDNNHTPLQLGTLGYESYGSGINDAGQVVGYSYLNNGPHHAVLWDASGIHDLGTLGGHDSSARGINNIGQVVGTSYLSNNLSTRAFIWDNVTGIRDLGTLSGGNFSQGNAISNSGQVAGFSNIANSAIHATFWDSSGIHDLGTLGGASSSWAWGMNNLDQVVGASDGVDTQAVMWQNGVALDLNSLAGAQGLGWFLNSANAINDSGQIVGTGRINGQSHTYLLTPVPVPAAAWLLGSGLLGLIGVTRRKAA